MQTSLVDQMAARSARLPERSLASNHEVQTRLKGLTLNELQSDLSLSSRDQAMA